MDLLTKPGFVRDAFGERTVVLPRGCPLDTSGALHRVTDASMSTLSSPFASEKRTGKLAGTAVVWGESVIMYTDATDTSLDCGSFTQALQGDLLAAFRVAGFGAHVICLASRLTAIWFGSPLNPIRNVSTRMHASLMLR